MIFSIFFFSSRRRHTRCLSDWSSDVCSSDLEKHRILHNNADQTAQPLRIKFADITSIELNSSGGWIVESKQQIDDGDRKSTRLNSSHLGISYAVFCLKKKTKIIE